MPCSALPVYAECNDPSLAALLTAPRIWPTAPGELSEKDAQDRRQAMMTTLMLPTFDGEDDEFSSK